MSMGVVHLIEVVVSLRVERSSGATPEKLSVFRSGLELERVRARTAASSLYDQRVRRLATVGLIVLALVVFGAAGYLILHNDDVPDAGQTPSLPPALSGSPSLASTGSSPASVTSAASGKPVVAFLGDDWVAGIGASATKKRFSALVSAALNFEGHNLGANGSGYAASTSSHNGDYASRVPAVVALHPQVVVVSGGRNDEIANDLDTAGNNATKLFATLHQKLPTATLIAVAPMWGDSDPPGDLRQLAAKVKSAVTAVGGHYLAIPDPIHGHSSRMADDADPNDAGYAAIAKALEPAIRPLIK
jgi:lysophospholipase L1-like esterase